VDGIAALDDVLVGVSYHGFRCHGLPAAPETIWRYHRSPVTLADLYIVGFVATCVCTFIRTNAAAADLLGMAALFVWIFARGFGWPIWLGSLLVEVLDP
jgi:hypothetical protein